MDKYKKKVLTIIGVILVIIAVMAIILSKFIKDDKQNNNINKPSTTEKDELSKEIAVLDDINVFFSLQNVINDYYAMIKNESTNDLLDVLDKDYLNTYNINRSNLYQILGSNLQSTSYVVKSIYYNPNSYLTYYFINGYFTNVSILDDDDFSEYFPNINYLIIVDNKNNYEITPLDRNINIEDYAKNYDLKDKSISSNQNFRVSSITEEIKLSIYINDFLDLIFYDNNRAYNMLDNNTQNKYNSLNDFKNNNIDIYNNLSSKIFSYGKTKNGDVTVYKIVDDKQNEITITENKIMDYKISY